jgi:HK97 family phage major capsid protein
MDEQAKKEQQELVKEVAGIVAPSVADEVVKRLSENRSARKAIFGGASEKEVANSELIEKKMKVADFIKALYNKDFASVKAMSEGTTGDGGFLVPTYFASEVIRLAYVYGVARANSRVVPMTGQILKYPTASTVTGYRIGEGSTITASKPTITQTTLTAKKLAVLVPMSVELVQDANVDVVDLLTRLSAEALAKIEDNWAFNGLAGGEGIIQNSSVPSVIMTSGNTTYDKVTLDNLLDMISNLDESAITNAKFYMSLSVFNSIRKIQTNTGYPIVQLPGQGMPATLWNIPVVFTRALPHATDQSQAGKAFIVLADLNFMLFGDRQQYTVDISRDATVIDTDGETSLNLFAQDMVALRVIERVDIEIAEAARAFVMLKTAAS